MILNKMIIFYFAAYNYHYQMLKIVRIKLKKICYVPESFFLDTLFFNLFLTIKSEFSYLYKKI